LDIRQETDMGFLRNKEIKLHLMVYVLLTVICTAAGLVISSKTGLLVLMVCSAFTLSSLALTYYRYRRLSSFAEDINKVLGGQDAVCLEDYSEGELAILQGEVKKLTLQLRSQAHALSKDKAYLADSLADISHQLRTPLTSMNLLAALLSQPCLEDSKRSEYVQDLQKQLSRIDWLVSSLLKISRLDAGTVKLRCSKVSVKTLVEKATSPLEISMDLKSQQLAVSIEGSESFTGDLAWSV
jgi:signal transduction histidine kinase